SSGLNRVGMKIKAKIRRPGSKQTTGKPPLPPQDDPPPPYSVEDTAPSAPPAEEPPAYTEIPVAYDAETQTFSPMEQTSDATTSCSKS
ncbi:MAG: hypothetical protein MI749_01830, partial [Desulfovibrionales bacterium]|nr:hypothetical protein [Desulfovibrionales bacterium]